MAKQSFGTRGPNLDIHMRQAASSILFMTVWFDTSGIIKTKLFYKIFFILIMMMEERNGNY